MPWTARKHRRQHVGPAVELHLARRQPTITSGARRVEITDCRRPARPPATRFERLQEMTINTRRGVTAADRRRRHQSRDQERHDQLQGLHALLRYDEGSVEQRDLGAARAGRHLRQPDQNIKDYGVRSGRPDPPRPRWVWGSVGKQFVDVASSVLQAVGRVPGRTRPARSRSPPRSRTSMPASTPTARCCRRPTSRAKCSCSRGTS